MLLATCQNLAKHIPIENEWPPILVFMGGNRVLYNFFQPPQYIYSDRRDASFELLNGTTGKGALLLLCSVIPIENALRGRKIRVK